MGCYNSKHCDEIIINTDFYKFRIGTFYIDISNLFIKNNYINEIINYFFGDYNGYTMDILCIQGIKDINMYNNIIKKFDEYIEEYNKCISYNNQINLYYYPTIKYSDKDTTTKLWSISNDNYNYLITDKIIISKYEILFSMDENHNIIKFNKNINIKTVTINFNNNIISIFNIDLSNNTLTNKDKICLIKKTFDKYKIQVENYSKEFSDIINRNIYLFCGNLGINEIEDNTINQKYIDLIVKLNIIDIFRYVMGIKNKIDLLKYNFSTNILCSRNTFIFMFIDNVLEQDNYNYISKIVYEKYGIVIIDSHIDNYMNNNFIHYPTNCILLLKKRWINNNNNKTSVYKQINFNKQ